ncbi:hypothetical protein QVD99_008487 [Batrachochytrium dendrobatidis]|nr:hypothetical protein QVD99_008487 [Batrachochytrium dendrobatidis]
MIKHHANMEQQLGKQCLLKIKSSNIISNLNFNLLNLNNLYACCRAIVLHKQSKSIVIIFRGTASSHEWRTNLNFAKAKLSPLLFTGSVGTIPPNVMVSTILL